MNKLKLKTSNNILKIYDLLFKFLIY